MSSDSTRRFADQSASQQQFLSLFLRSERNVFYLFNRPLKGDEIRALYSSGKPQPDPLIQTRN